MTTNKCVFILQRQTETAQTAYARDTLTKELGRIGISVIPEQKDATAVLTLDVSGDAHLEPQAFELVWSTPVDKENLYDPHFTWHGHEAASLLDIDSTDVTSPQGNIRGGDEAGLLYGALEFIERCRVRNRLPIRPITVVRRPKMPFRSACLLLIRGSTYCVSISRAEFPWFYDKAWWTRYLDFMAAQGFTAVTLWNMHPFPFFCKIPNHPEATEITPDQLAENHAMLQWLCVEFARRNMWIIWHFYNIYVTPSFARHHGLPGISTFRKDQVGIVESYMRECVSAFVNEFPAAGLMACVGEGVPGGVAEAFAGNVLIDAVNRTGRHPPFILRQWSVVTVDNVRRHVLGKYDNLYVMIKHAAEHVGGAVPDSRVQKWLDMGVPLLVNMHMLSEVDPWHWAPPAFIRECCLNYQAMGLKGLHLYSHWPWRVPLTAYTGVDADEYEHNWIYHEAWGRYLFDPIRDHDEENRHWVRRITRTGVLPATAQAVADYLDLSARCLPRLQQHLWIHYDNHSVLSAGFTLGQMLRARSMHGRKTVRTDRLEDLMPLRFQAQGTAGSSADDYTFSDACAKSRLEMQRTLACLAGAEAGDPASPLLRRLKVEGQTILKVIDFLDRKAEALCRLQEYLRTQTWPQIEEAERKLSESLVLYREVAKTGDELFKVISDVPPVYPFLREVPDPYHWREILPLFEEELINLRSVMRIEQSSEAWNLLWQSGDPRVRPGAALAAEIVKEGGIWLTGLPEFLPSPWRFERLKRMEIMPSNSFIFDEYNGNLMAYPNEVRAWVERGGRLVFYSFYGYPWGESKFLAKVVGSEELETQSVEVGGQKLIGIKDPASRWTWIAERDGYGVDGTLALGRGAIRYSAKPGKD